MTSFHRVQHAFCAIIFPLKYSKGIGMPRVCAHTVYTALSFIKHSANQLHMLCSTDPEHPLCD